MTGYSNSTSSPHPPATPEARHLFVHLFVGIQHPGETGGSHFPGGDSVPRSTIVAVTRNDGGTIA